MRISLIVAIGKRRQIGKDGKMLWHIREDFRHFKQTTLGHWLIMGRKTFHSIGGVLPGRKSVVLTGNRELAEKLAEAGAYAAANAEEALAMAREAGESEVFICGGENVYRHFLERCDRLYLSRVDFDGEADTFFPPFEHLPWKLVKSHQFPAQKSSLSWCLEILEIDYSVKNLFLIKFFLSGDNKRTWKSFQAQTYKEVYCETFCCVLCLFSAPICLSLRPRPNTTIAPPPSPVPATS